MLYDTFPHPSERRDCAEMPFGIFFFKFIFYFLKTNKLGNKMNLYERVTKRPAADWLFCWLTLGVSWVLTETFWCGWRTRCTAHHAECLFLLFTVPIFFFCLFFYSIQDHSGALEVTEELQMGWGTFPVALWCTFILFFNTSLRQAVTSHCPDVILRLHHHLFPFWLWLHL